MNERLPHSRYRFPKKVGIIFVERRKEILKISIKNFIKVLTYKMKQKRSRQRQKTLFLDFDQDACAFFLTAMNFHQNIFEFQIIDGNSQRLEFLKLFHELDLQDQIEKAKNNIDTTGNVSEIILNWLDNIALRDPSLDYWIAITSEGIEENWFFTTKGVKETKSRKRLWIITSRHWERFYSPPSLFEYFATSIIRMVVESLTRELQKDYIILDKINSLESHYPNDVTRGCIFDFTNYKPDRRILVSNPNLCYACKHKLSHLQILVNNKLGKAIPLAEELNRVISRDWMGNLEQKGSAFYNLKEVYKYDVKRNSGFNKGNWERIRDSIVDKTAEWTIGTVIVGIVSAIVGYFLYLMFGIKT